MSHHPSSTLSAACFAGGIYGFSRTRSMPSLIGGFALGSLFAISSIRIRDGLDYAYEAATASSLLLLLAGAPRFSKGRAPKILTGLGAAGTAYYAKQVYDFRR